ncbi:ThuA-like domain-containing protein [Hyaloraphidium curvatum]|nr:ThuA-like domain-containing protein [Hyaloraphidium curvatum]
MAAQNPRKIQVMLVVGGLYHDMDFSRLEILKLLAEDPHVRTRVFEDYANTEALAKSDALITYTCDVVPTVEQQEALRAFVERGGRWLALHATSAILEFLPSGLVDTPKKAPHLMDTLGARFVAHPPIAPYPVHIVDPEHPLVKGLKEFEAKDELYLLEPTGKIEVLLDTEFEGDATGYAVTPWAKARHPVLYLHPLGKGAVCYFTLGHCRGHFDMQPIIEYMDTLEKGSWALPEFYEILRRGIAWAKDAEVSK